MPTLVTTANDVSPLLDQLEHAQRVAIDTEFHAERRYLPRLYLVQVKPEHGDTFLLDPLAPGVLDAVRGPLSARPWVVHGGARDLQILHAALGSVPDIVLDTQVAHGLVSTGYPARLDHLLKHMLDVDPPAAATLSDWSVRPLTAQQLTYAAGDVEHMLSLWDALEARLRELGRLDIALAACAAHRHAALTPVDAGSVWRHLPASAHLNGRQAMFLQELTRWRELHARRANQPARSVIHDALLVDLARRAPLTIEQLTADRRMSKRVVKQHGLDLVRLLDAAAVTPHDAQPPVAPFGTPGWQLASLLELVAHIDGTQRRYGARLLMPRTLAEDLVFERSKDSDPIANLLGPWRQAVIGTMVADVLNGSRGVQYDDGDLSLSPPLPQRSFN